MATKTNAKKKTILVVYTTKKLSEIKYEKRYSFNTTSDIKEGELIKSPSYETAMRVVKVLPKAYKYFNRETGELSDKITGTNIFEIRDLKILNTIENEMVATRIKE